MSEGPSRSERLAAAYKRLAASATNLSAASDEFSKPVSELDSILQRLNIGLITWKKVVGGEDDYDNYWSRDIGYAKLDRRRWGLAIRTRSGNHRSPDPDDFEEWPFNEAPRSYQIEAIDKLPELIEELTTASEKTAKKLREKTIEVRELAAVMKQAAEEAKPPKKERR